MPKKKQLLLSDTKADANSDAPLAVRMRPRNLEEFMGQASVLGEQTLLRKAITADRLTSLIIYGPPGVGKTSLGRLVSEYTQRSFVYVNAALSSVAEIKEIMQKASKEYGFSGKKTVFFVDEIHRFNKMQQDILLAYLESPHLTIIGATLYNPFYYLVPALVSRSIVVEFKPLASEELILILKNALYDKVRGLGDFQVEADDDALLFLAEQSAGDARKALNALEIGVLSLRGDGDSGGAARFTIQHAQESIQKKRVVYDRDQDGHYDTISSFIKSVRGSDVDSALYWLAKMVYAGEDPRFIARRLIILAAEDIGNADPFSLVLATSCFNAVEYIGMPEARIVLSETTIYMALAPKSNASYEAISQALADVEQRPVEEAPEHLKMKTDLQRKMTPGTAEYVNPHTVSRDTQSYRSRPKRYYVPRNAGRESKLIKGKENT